MEPDRGPDRAPEAGRVEELFAAACRLPEAERAAFLDRACGADAALRAEVQSLLEHDGHDALERIGAAAAEDLRALDAAGELPGDVSGLHPEHHPERIGDYSILSVIGAGGMGVVYEARQSSPDRRVALKVIRPGLASERLLRRFEHEAQVLGWLDHPGIARIFEAGADDTGLGPQPYFAMELVRGEPLHRHAQRVGLDVRGRLELVARTAEAVHHAHQKGVVHRDLKPANVLVDGEGQPRVLDFGVARVTDRDLEATTTLTGAGELVGTLPYMSPEQVGGDPAAVDARSDVYSLGVLAYELLSGELPHDVVTVPLPEAARRITEDEPTSLGRHDRRLKGDVEIIVGKALASDPERRYGSAEELATDIRRHLADEPILARPPSGTYQLVKFARRNRALVGGLALAFLALAVGATVSTVQFLDARAGWAAEREQRELAEANALAAGGVSDFLVQLFEVPDSSREWGREVTARELLDRGVRDIREGLRDQPGIRAELMGTMGRAYGNLGLYAEAEPLLTEALAQSRAQGDDEATALALLRLGRVEGQAGAYAAAAERLREAHGLLLGLGEDGREALPAVLDELAAAELRLGEYAAAEEHVLEAIELLEGRHGAGSLEATRPRNTLVALLQTTDRFDEALALAREVLDTRREHLGEDHPRVLAALRAVGQVLYEQNDQAAALEIAREVHALTAEHLEPSHPTRMDALLALALGLQEAGELTESLELLTTYEEHARTTYGESNPRYASALHSLGMVQWELGDFPESRRRLEAALAIREEVLGPDHLDVASTLSGLATMLTTGMRLPLEAIPHFERALEIVRAELGDEPTPTTLTILSGLSNAHAYAGQFERAGVASLELLELYREQYGPDDDNVARTLHTLSLLRKTAGDVEGALEYAYECRRIQELSLPEDHPERAFNLDVIARCYIDLDRHEEAEQLLERALDIRRASLPPDHVHIAESESLMAMCLMERGAFDQAEPLLLHVLDIARKTYPPDHPQMRFVYARAQNLYRKWGKGEEADRYLELYQGSE